MNLGGRQLARIAPLYSSLGDRVRLRLKTVIIIIPIHTKETRWELASLLSL